MHCCLDPAIPFHVREKLLPFVTAALHECLRNYPQVSFHAHSQKLAIGVAGQESTSGSIIIWDLRTATRVQILDAHSPHPVQCLAFNRPAKDADLLLASYSLVEGAVKIWQPSSGVLNALSMTFAGFGMGSGRQQQQQPQPAADGNTGNQAAGILHSLTGGGVFRHFRTFRIDQSQMAAPKSPDGQPNPQQFTAGFEWVGERSVSLRRPEPLPALTLTV